MKRIVFLTLISVLLSLFVSSVEAAMQERTLRIENRKVLDVRVAYCYVVHPDDVDRIGEKAGYHVKGWVRVPSGRSITVTYPNTGYDPLFLLGVISDGRQLVPKPTLGQQELPVHPKKNFEVLLALNGDIIDATTENNGINHRVEEKDLDWFEFGKKLAPDEFVWVIQGPVPLNYDGDYDMEGFIRERHGKDYALLFATNAYMHWDDLSTPIADAEAIGAELENRYGFNVDIRKNVTIKQILAALAEYTAKEYATGDQLFVYFAGHGNFSEEMMDGYITASNSELPKADPVYTTHLSYAQLKQYLDRLACSRILLVLDVNYGGTFDDTIALGPPTKDNTPIKQEVPANRSRQRLDLAETLKVKTRWYLSSGGKENVFDQTANFTNSPFASALMRTLKGSGSDVLVDGVLTLPEIERQLQRNFQAELTKLEKIYQRKLKQTPSSGPFKKDEAADKVFVFIKAQK